MCGRYALTVDPSEFLDEMGLAPDSDAPWSPRWNIAPTQDAPVVLHGRDGRPRVERFRWGLVPHWADAPAVGTRMINARAETVASKAAFRDAFQRRRCLVPASGFYEWRAVAGNKHPWWIHGDAPVLTFAGLWERWRAEDGERLHTFTILTTRASAWIAPLHHRMPVVIDPEDRSSWLEGDMSAERLHESWDGRLTAEPVSVLVNSPKNDDPECQAPVGPPLDPRDTASGIPIHPALPQGDLFA